MSPVLSARLGALDWQPLVNGDPPTSGNFLVGHRGMARVIYYLHPDGEWLLGTKTGWRDDVTWASHWTAFDLPTGPEPQLCKEAGRHLRAKFDDMKAWERKYGPR